MPTFTMISEGSPMPRNRAEHTIVYPRNQIEPEDLLNFWELDWFYDSWEEYELTDDDLAALQILIMCRPRNAPVVSGTKGLRKLRFSPEGWNTGKSRALRVCYVYFEKYGVVLLCLLFRKGILENFSEGGKKAINKAIGRIEAGLLLKFGF